MPPSSGPHFAAPAVSERKFYTAADRPPLETLVHNLEHGYTVLWYDGAQAKGKEQLLRDIAEQGNKQPEAQDKFLVVEWDSSRGAFPADKPYALAHWAKDTGKRQMCGDLSGARMVWKGLSPFANRLDTYTKHCGQIWPQRDRPNHLYLMRWTNRRPETKITHIDVVSANKYYVPMLLGITAACRK